MPRRTHPTQPTRKRKRPEPQQPPTRQDKATMYTAMARSLVARGLASQGILESTTNNPRHHTSYTPTMKAHR